MRHVIKIFLTFILSIIILPTLASIQGRIDYSIPIYYDVLDKNELENKAEFYYNSALKNCDGNINDDMTSALNLYSILNKKDPKKQLYLIKLGKMYDIVSQDRLAKSCFNQAIGIDSTKPEPFFYMGEFYYKREQFRLALKFYIRAYNNGYLRHYDTVYKMGDIYQKLGDTEKALKYFKTAYELNPSLNLQNKITTIENYNARNSLFYKSIPKKHD